MKTPIQELIERLKEYNECCKENCGKGIDITVLLLSERMLDKEKEVMCEWAEAYENRDDSNVGTVEECYDAYFNL